MSLDKGRTLNDTRFPANRLGLGLVVALLAIVTFLPTLQNDFVEYDDYIYVTQNRHVKSGLSSEGIVYALTTFDSMNWIPVTWLSYELDSTLFGIHPAPFHAVNVGWHAFNAWLLFQVLSRMTGSLYRSALVAALFAVHPLRVESVAWVSERKDLLSTCGLLLTLLAYYRYALAPSRMRYVLVCVTMTLGLLAKSMLVTLPVLLLLVDLWPLQRVRDTVETTTDLELDAGTFQRTWPQLVIEKIPLLILAFVDGIITMLAQQSSMPGAGLLSFQARLGNAVVSVCWYLWKTVWPTGLCAFYRHERNSLSPLVVTACAVLLVVLTVLALWRGRRHKDALFGWAWFVISLLPVLGLIQVGSQAHADRYTYIPHIGLITMIVWEGHRILGRVPAGKWIGITLAGCSLAACLVLTNIQIQTWRNTITLWQHAIKFDRYNPIAHFGLAEQASKNKDWDAAYEHFSNVLVYLPSIVECVTSLGRVQEQRGELEEAREYYLWALRLSPNDSLARNRLARLPRFQLPRRSDRAQETTVRAVQQFRRGNMAAGARLLQDLADSEPSDVIAQNNLARVLEDLNQPDVARRYYEKALQVEPHDVEARHGVDRLNKRQSQAR